MSQLIAGTARVDITPTDLTGLNPMGVSFEAVHDPIHLRVLTLDDGDTRLALVTADLIEVGDTKDVRKRIAIETEIPAHAVMIAPSHSHNAPRIGLVPPGGKARIPSPESLAYTETVYDAMVTGVKAALAGARPAMIATGHTDVDVNVNREVHVGDHWDLGYNADGPSDKTLKVVVVKDQDGPIRAVLMNYAVHSTVCLGTEELGADLAGAASSIVEAELPGAVALWTSGALGDQAPRVSLGTPSGDQERDRRFANCFATAQGMLVGAGALRVARLTLTYDPAPRLTAAERVVACPARKLEVPPGMEQAAVDTVELTLNCLTVGSTALVGVSGEVTVPVYRSLQEASPLTATLLVSNSNARIGYLPGDESYDRDTQASRGCPIVKGHAESTIVGHLADMIATAITAP